MRMIADVPLGAFFSGGIDSSAVVALMQAQSSRAVKTFTIGFEEDEYNEAAYAKKVAAHLGTEHTELYVRPQDALDVVPLLPEMFDEPFADSSQIPTFLISRLARQHVTVGLAGDCGDELFGGYGRYFSSRSLWKFVRLFPAGLRALAAKMMGLPGLQRMAPGLLRRKLRTLATYLPGATPGTIYLRTLSHWHDPSELVIDADEPRTVRQSRDRLAQLPSVEEMMMLTDLLNYLPDDVLAKVDGASMATGLEARVPLLDHRVVEFAWKLPLHFKIRRGVSKWILRQVLYKYVPASVVERPKKGFGVPI